MSKPVFMGVMMFQSILLGNILPFTLYLSIEFILIGALLLLVIAQGKL